MPAPRAIDTLLAQYRSSHLNRTNEIIHLVCIPGMVFTLLGLTWAIHPLAALALNLAALRYYFKLSKPFAIGMLAMSALILMLLLAMPPTTILPLSLAIFVLAGFGQFVGHVIEGKTQSLIDDARSLPIAPLFLLSFLYRRFNIDY